MQRVFIIKGIKGNFTKGYNAEVVAKDIQNDLAILKVHDVIIPSASIPYSIKSNNAEVGEEVFVLGYPLTSTMGDEIKLTTGVISARSGFLGNVSLYQISAPIQPGNSIIMERIFRKDFKFSVDSYEEYQNQKCISSGDIDAVIYCHIFGNKAHFVITGMEGLKIDNKFDFNVEHPHSNMLEAGGMVASPRIQYMSDSLGTDTEPYICHLFCNYGQIVTVRFGFADFKASGILPWPKRIYEFSGDMEELDVLSEKSKTCPS